MELARLFRGVPMVLSTPSQPRGVVSDIGFAPQLVIATPGAEPRVRGESPAQCEYRAVAILDAWTSLYASGIEPTRKILDIASENENVDFALFLAKILRELTAQTGNIT